MLWLMVQLGYAVVPYDADVLLEKLSARQHLRQHRELENCHRSRQVLIGLPPLDKSSRAWRPLSTTRSNWLGCWDFCDSNDHLYASADSFIH